MKILFFSSYFYPYISGLTTYPWKILNHFSKKHQITVLTFNHKKNKLFKIKNKNLKIIYLPYFFRFSKGFVSPQSFYYFFKEAKKVDLIILNQPNVEGFFLAVLAKIFNKKTFSLVHCFLHGGKNIFEKLIFKIANFFVYLQIFLSDKLIFYTKDYFRNNFFYKFFKKKKIYYHLPPIKKFAIDKIFFKKLLKFKENKSFLIGFSGRIASEKGIEYLIKAIFNLKSIIKSYKILFAGPYGKNVSGEEKYFLKIKKMLDENKISYKFLGNLKENQLGAFYKTIDVLVLPSINSTEAFGMVQAEAIILGAPVIATNLPGVRIPVKLTKMGILVEPKNEKQLSQALIEIFKNRKKYTNRKLIKNARKIFNIKKVYKFWSHIITSV